MRKVKIISCPYKEWWYSKYIGHVFEVQDKELKEDYITAEKHQRDKNDELNGHQYILKTDCIIVQ